MRLLELVFREINVVLVHAGVNVQGISLDRLRSARPAANIHVASSPAALSVTYTDERLAVHLDGQRITATDTSSRGAESSPVVEAALVHHGAIGAPVAVAFGYNVRFDFRVEGVGDPEKQLREGLLRSPSSLAGALGVETFQLGVKLVFPRGVKTWMFHLEPQMGSAGRLAVHANVHEDLRLPPGPEGPPPPAWLAGSLQSSGPAFPGVESMKDDLVRQVLASMETTANILRTV